MLNVRTASLVALTVQATLHGILMKVSINESAYSTAVAVVLDELTKLVVCIGILTYFYRTDSAYSQLGDGASGTDPSSQRRSITGFMKYFVTEVFGSFKEFLSMGVPALCYSFQKNMIFLAVANLSPAMYQVLGQGKILTTAFFAHLILKKGFSKRQQLALLVLAVGVALAQLADAGTGSGESGNPLVGYFAMLLVCVSSGFSGVYIEYKLKSQTGSTEPKANSLWVRNVQLAIFGALSATIGAILSDGTGIAERGILYGFTGITWSVIMLSSLGGLLVAVVMKYADNILKNLATAVAIILVSIVSAMFFNFHISLLFVAGALLVITAVHLYSTNPPPTPAAADEEELGLRGDGEMQNLSK